eukprot:Tamp_23185.p2 GENE.Tamp_23185~~Tamp_23185.p2  ORF type:complete len:114 (+),score=13.97 Tamp_23185:237-578(+)
MGECRVHANVFLLLVQGLLYTILTNSKEARDEVNFLDADTWPEILRQHLEDAAGGEVSLALCAWRAEFWKPLTRHCCTLFAARGLLHAVKMTCTFRPSDATTIRVPRNENLHW